MTDKEIEFEIRKNLRKSFPDIVFQVTYVDRSLHVEFVGGNLGQFSLGFTEEMKERIMESVWEINPEFELWFDEE